jgi:predicted short-subunit dehydrogenase-like oxidoreductase (DUF2520 family)
VAEKKIQDIVMIGAGNMASHLGLALHRQKFNVVQVCNRTPDRGIRLATKIGAEFISDPRKITPHADIYILAVSDAAIEDVGVQLHLQNQLVVHTSGTIDMEILANVSGNTGVFYPLQTFSGRKRIEFQRIPLCIEANSTRSGSLLMEMANRLSGNVHLINSENRKMLHLSAVFASNFTNFMHVVAEELLDDQKISFDLLRPLIRQTVQNTRMDHLFHYQTGPAVRGDSLVLDQHRALLTSHPAYLELYNMISENIIKYKSLHGKL